MTGIYVHIPFCKSKCNYCDFYSVCNDDLKESYFNRLYEEISSYKKYGKIKIDTIFFGGGTPSLVDEKYILKTLEEIDKVFDIDKNSEITLEANPRTFSKDKLRAYINNGINRISMGLQSANNDELKKIGRLHTREDFLRAYNDVREIGFSNVNTDIIYGLMDSSLESLSKTAQFVKELNCEHISAYALTISENTPLYKMDFSYPDDDEVYAQYKFLCSYFSDYRHYEISNFGKKICRHNMKYWDMSDYIGFGAGAYSYFMGERFSNISDIGEYIKRENPIAEKEKRDNLDELNEEIMLSLRTDTGLNTDRIKEKYGYDTIKEKGSYIESFIKNGYAKNTKNGFSLTDDGFFVSNSVISHLLVDKN